METCVFGFTPSIDCNNCTGTGVFMEDANGKPEEACIFCLEDAIRRGEINGTIDNTEWVNGVASKEP